MHLGIIRNTWEDQNSYDHDQVLYSNACQANYGFVQSETGRPLIMVAIFRADQWGVFCNNGGCTVNGQACHGSIGCEFSESELSQNSGNARFYCSSGPHCYNAIPAGATTWETDMLASPSQSPNPEVQICQMAEGAAKFYCSAWH